MTVMTSLAWRVSQRPDGARALHGIRLQPNLDARDPKVRAHVAAAALPKGAALGSWAAATLLGVPETWVDGRTSRGELAPVPVTVARPGRPYVRRGLQVIQAELEPEDVIEVDGVPLTSGVRTAFDQMRGAATLGDAVAAGDAALRFGLTTVEELGAYVAERPRWRGVPRARAALPLLDGRTESPPESVFRTIWVRSRLGMPEPQVVVLDRGGAFIARMDLVDREAGVGGEYQGAAHREGERPRADTQRFRALDAAGMETAAIWAEDLRDPRLIREGLLAAYRRARRRPSEERTYVLRSTPHPTPRGRGRP